MEQEHERGFDSGYSAAIHDALVEGSRAHHELHNNRIVGMLRVFNVTAKVDGELRWNYDVVAVDELGAEALSKEFVLTDESLQDLAAEKAVFKAERARDLGEPYGWVIGVRP